MMEPQVRALTTLAALQAVEAMPADLRQRILRDAGDLEAARRAYAFSWIPLPLQMRMLEAMRRNLSPTEWRESQRRLMFAYLEKPVLRGLFDMAVRVIGLSVETLARWCPRAYAALFQNAGMMTFELGTRAGESILVLHDFPKELFASGTFAEAMQSAIETMFPLAKTTGTVTMSNVDLSRGHARYTLHSQP